MVTDDTVAVQRADLTKILDVLVRAAQYLFLHDRMNAELYVSRTVIQSPLTVEVITARNRLEELLRLEEWLHQS